MPHRVLQFAAGNTLPGSLSFGVCVMRLTRKLALALTCAILVVLGGNSIIRVRREVALFEENSRTDNELLGRAVAGAAALTFQRVGEEEALDLVEDANQRESQVLIRWVWLDAPVGDERAPDLPVNSLAPIGRGETVELRATARGPVSDALYTYVPVHLPGPRLAAIELQESLATEQAYLRRTILQTSIATATLLALCAGITFGLGVLLVGRPVRRLVEQARRIGAGDLSLRIDVHQRDEIGDLALEMNAMSDRLLYAHERVETETTAKIAAVEQLRHADRLTTVGKLASGIAHEIGTPLNVMTGHAQLIMDEHPAGSAPHANALVIAQQVRRVAGIVRQLLDFARPRVSHRVLQALGPIVKQVASLLDSLAQKRGVRLEVVVPESEISALVDAGQLQQVVTNLLVNAIHATPSGGCVTVGTERAVATAGPARAREDCACVFVSDHGTGIAPDVLPRIFEPFFTTKGTGEGTGLGLAVAYGIVKEHGGWIAVDSVQGAGSHFTVYLPIGGRA